ncbi:glycoside hydrolase family 25 protein [Caproiciproducens sp.]|uniref:glycoside hydrolase family 25 protein n=1 Tax=Caproiciproducens sp. TaxID=1954376 RepID=UPI0028A1151A|nr:glycoside hydrolase family 25 protein [Caproiciproducens sp.]
MNGIDISKHNGTIDWEKVKVSGIDFVLIRAGYGNDISQKDSKFDEYIKAALARNIHVGVYWFSYAVSIADAQKEAEVCKKVLAPYMGQIDFPVAFDYEYDSITYAQKHNIKVTDSIDSIARAFMDSMQRDGWFVNLYTNNDFIRSGRFSAATIKAYDVWLADYSGAPDYSCYIQQIGSTGTVPGISGNVDMDIAYKDYPTIIQAGGYNGYPKPQSTVVGIDTTMDISFARGTYYTVKTTSPQPVKLTFGTNGVVTIVPSPRTDNEQLFAIVPIGQPGQETGIYTASLGERPLRRFVFKIQ